VNKDAANSCFTVVAAPVGHLGIFDVVPLLRRKIDDAVVGAAWWRAT
jgi:hypothetical protein